MIEYRIGEKDVGPSVNRTFFFVLYNRLSIDERQLGNQSIPDKGLNHAKKYYKIFPTGKTGNTHNDLHAGIAGLWIAHPIHGILLG
jgi:hypothetical protein